MHGEARAGAQPWPVWGVCLCEGDVVCLHLSGCEMLYDAFIGRWVGRRRQTLRATSVLKDP